MERLNSELADTLRDLIDMEERGEDVTMYMFDVMCRDTGSLRDRQHLLELAEAGCADIKSEGTTTSIEGLTSYGRSYFRDLKEQELRERKRIWSDRRFQLGLSIATLMLSGAVSLGVSLLVSLLT